MLKGIVTLTTGSWYEVLTSENNSIKARLKGKFKLDDIKSTNPIAIGDRVVVEWDKEYGDYSISEIEQRSNYIVRQSPRQKHTKHIIAANIDQILIVAGISKPRTSLGFIDRCILAAECFHIPTKIILNKVDIHTDKDNQVLEKWQAIYQNVGYDLITCSATRGDNLEIINTAIRNKTTLICGHSGVGKSSLLNALHPQLSIRTQKISSKWSKGMHTTTFAHMHILDENTFLIDTPGIKEFFNIEIEPNELAGYFVEFKPFLNKCAFHNCLHQNEQQCAIKTAVSNDEIFADRYINYLNILDQLQNVNYWERM